MTAVEKVEIQINDFVRRIEYREDLTRIESRVNSLAESQAMTSMAIQNMNSQMSQTNKKLDDISSKINTKLDDFDKNLAKLAENKSFMNGLIKGSVNTIRVTIGVCAVILTLDYSGIINGIIRIIAKFVN